MPFEQQVDAYQSGINLELLSGKLKGDLKAEKKQENVTNNYFSVINFNVESSAFAKFLNGCRQSLKFAKYLTNSYILPRFMFRDLNLHVLQPLSAKVFKDFALVL